MLVCSSNELTLSNRKWNLQAHTSVRYKAKRCAYRDTDLWTTYERNERARERLTIEMKQKLNSVSISERKTEKNPPKIWLDKCQSDFRWGTDTAKHLMQTIVSNCYILIGRHCSVVSSAPASPGSNPRYTIKVFSTNIAFNVIVVDMGK